MILALHGVPTSPRLWERLSVGVEAPVVPGLGADGTAQDWSLQRCAAQLEPQARQADILVGHDLGGVVAAMLARPGQTLVLSGTALGPYWAAVRATALPVLRHFFYARYAGRRFLAEGCNSEHTESLLEAFGDHGPDWPERMTRIATQMKPPQLQLDGVKVVLAWGRSDPWYPAVVAHALARRTGASIHWLDAGHFAPWEDPDGFSTVLTQL